MSGVRVLRLYHGAVVGEYRERERWLRDKHGYDVHTVCPPVWDEGARRVRARPVRSAPVHILPVYGRRHPILFWYSPHLLRRLVRRLAPQIVDIHEEPYSLAAWSALRQVEAAAPSAAVCVYSAQNVYKRYPRPFAQIERRVLARAAAAYPCSRAAAGVLSAKGFSGALSVLPLGVVLDSRARQGTDGRLLVGFVGRLSPEKGADVAIAAFAKATAGLEASLEIVGAGAQEPELRDQTRALGVEDRVSFAGALPQQEALARIRAFDVLLVPSLPRGAAREQFGRTAAEALAAGTPVIASKSGALPEVLGRCAELVAPGDIDAWAAALGSLLRDPCRRSALARAGRTRAAAKLTWERVADGMDALYREALERG